MSLDNLLRAYARQELKRLCPAAHYWMRDHNPQADRELTEPLLHEPARFALTPRELAAAHALADLATYEIRSRAIWSEAFPVRDTSDTSEVGAMSKQQTREIDARREVYRRSALVYAQMLKDDQLIEGFQPLAMTPSAAPMAAASTPAARGTAKKLTENQEAEVRRRHAAGEPKAKLARAFSVSRPTIDKCLRDRGIAASANNPFGQATSLKRKR